MANESGSSESQSRESAHFSEVQREQWENFLNNFSRDYDGWIATIEVLGREGEHEVEIRERVFRGSSFDHPGTGETRIFLGFDDRPEAHLIHSIINPTRVEISGKDLRIYSADESVSVLHLLRPGSQQQKAA